MIEITFPKELQNNYKTSVFLVRLNESVINCRSEYIIFNLAMTKIFATNHLAMLMYVIEGINARKNELIVQMPSEKCEGLQAINKLYHY